MQLYQIIQIVSSFYSILHLKTLSRAKYSSKNNLNSVFLGRTATISSDECLDGRGGSFSVVGPRPDLSRPLLGRTLTNISEMGRPFDRLGPQGVPQCDPDNGTL